MCILRGLDFLPLRSTASAYTAELLSSRGHLSSRRPSLNSGFSETTAWTQPNFTGSYMYLSAISPNRFNFHVLRFLALFSATAEQSYCPSSVVCRRPSVDIIFSKTVKWIGTKFWCQVLIHHISRQFFLILNF